MPTQAKAAVIEEITERFQKSSAAVLTEYRGLTVAQLTQLRRSLGAGSSYAVVKNTLTKRAAEQVGHADLAPLLNGPTAIAFIEGDPVTAAKAIRDFARTHPLLVIKGGVVEGRTVSPAEVTALADVEPREVLLAKLAGAMIEARSAQAVGSSTVRLRVRLGSTGMPGPIVVETVTFFRYRPLAAAGLARSTSSRAAA